MTAVAQPADPPSEGSDGLARQARDALSGAAGDTELLVVRRYREEPSPLVRDSVRQWRTGRADAVFAGDFDLIC